MLVRHVLIRAWCRLQGSGAERAAAFHADPHLRLVHVPDMAVSAEKKSKLGDDFFSSLVENKAKPPAEQAGTHGEDGGWSTGPASMMLDEDEQGLGGGGGAAAEVAAAAEGLPGDAGARGGGQRPTGRRRARGSDAFCCSIRASRAATPALPPRSLAGYGLHGACTGGTACMHAQAGDHA
eukprot:363803-Chlamydomonas_euryale.AAC.11